MRRKPMLLAVLAAASMLLNTRQPPALPFQHYGFALFTEFHQVQMVSGPHRHRFTTSSPWQTRLVERPLGLQLFHITILF